MMQKGECWKFKMNLQKCPKCNGEMADLFTSSYCKNECEKTPIKFTNIDWDRPMIFGPYDIGWEDFMSLMRQGKQKEAQELLLSRNIKK